MLYEAQYQKNQWARGLCPPPGMNGGVEVMLSQSPLLFLRYNVE